MAMYLCSGGSGSEEVNLISLYKKYLNPNWLPNTPLTTPLNLSNFAGGSYYYYPIVAAAAVDQHKYILPSDFNYDHVYVVLNQLNLTILFSEDPVTIDNNGYIVLPNRRYFSVYGDTDQISFITSNDNKQTTYANRASYSRGITGIADSRPTMILFSTDDIVSPNNTYFVYKNINKNDIEVIRN